MKKVIAVVLAMILALSISAVAFAADTTSTTSIPTMTCPVCGKVYLGTTAGLEAYNKCLDSHRDADDYFVCQTCGKKYEDPTSYVRCLNSHIELATYTCETCGAKFSDQAAFDAHVATHFNDVNYHWTQYVNMTLPELTTFLYDLLNNAGVIQIIYNIFNDLWTMIKDGIASQQEAANVAGAADRLDSALDGIGLDSNIISNLRAVLNAIKQKVKDFYAHDVETAPATETEAPVETGSATAGIAAFAVITAAAAAAYVCSKKKA